MNEPTHLLFDFFGTLVDYNPSRTAQGYRRSHALARQWGATASYHVFLAEWVHTSAALDRRSDADDSEFSMFEACEAFLRRLGCATDDVAAFERLYLAEWSAGVSYPDGVEALVKELSGRYRLAVVSNTHSRTLVPEHLDRMGLAGYFDAVVLSVEVGWRKPHPAIYRAALDRLGVDAAQACFVGDTYVADYAGPTDAGMTAYLIDPHRLADVPDDRRLATVFDLPARLYT
jgi:putative hydrolase of the HAD superfamily